MDSDDPRPSKADDGGINARKAAQAVVITQMLDIGNGHPVREDALRARFLSFDSLFDADANLVAHQLVLRGRAAPIHAPAELRQMEEDMLLTGLYSLTQGGLDSTFPLLVRISAGVLFSDVPRQINHRQVIWCVDIDNAQHLGRALALRDAGLTFCPALNPRDAVVQESAAVWRYLNCHADETPPKQAARLIVDGVQHVNTQARWPANTWFKSGFFSGDTPAPTEIVTHDHAVQLDLLAIALRESSDTLGQFFRLNPDMAPRLLAIANSPAGGLSRPAESAAHALVMLGPQRASRIAALLALVGKEPTEASRHYAVTALTRALFMGKVTRLGSAPHNAAAAFEIGLLSIAPHALALPMKTLIRRLGLSAASARALSARPSPEGAMLQLAYACENNDVDTLTRHARQLGLPMHQISVAYLDAMMAASALDAALH